MSSLVDAMEKYGRQKDDALSACFELGNVRKRADQLEKERVMTARKFKWSWQQIADALGCDRSTVYEKYIADERRWREGVPNGHVDRAAPGTD